MIFLYQRMLHHYRIPVYHHLNEAVKNQIVVIYGQQPNKATYLTENDQIYAFRTLKLRNWWFDGERLLWQSFFRAIQVFGKPDVIMIEHSSRILQSYPLLAYCRVRCLPFILWGHGGSRSRDIATSNSAKDLLNRWFIRQCDAYICYTEPIKDKLSDITGADKLFVATNTLDTDVLFRLRKKLELVGRGEVKRRLGLSKKYYLGFIGRLTPEKQPDMLLDTLQMLQQNRDDIGAIIIGDGAEMQKLRQKSYELELDDVHFTGSIAEWELSAPYLFVCNVIVNPGCVGLSVNHAFSFGLPVVTQQTGSRGSFHGPEVAFIKEGYTGYLTPTGNVEVMADRVAAILDDRERWYQNVIGYAENELTIDRMIDGAVGAIRYAVQQKKC